MLLTQRRFRRSTKLKWPGVIEFPIQSTGDEGGHVDEQGTRKGRGVQGGLRGEVSDGVRVGTADIKKLRFEVTLHEIKVAAPRHGECKT